MESIVFDSKFKGRDMKKIKPHLLIISMFVVLIHAPHTMYGSEVKESTTEGSVSFSGIYQPIGAPDPSPDYIARPIDIENDQNVDNHTNLPKTNTVIKDVYRWLGLGIVGFLLYWRTSKK